MTRAASGGWRVRICLPAGPVCGAGVLIDPEHVVTCAHVVPGGRHTPEGAVVEFPDSADRRARHVTVVAFEPPGDGERGDVAVLRLTGAAPPDVVPARLAACGTVTAGREGRAYRLAGPGPAGGGAPGRLVRRNGPGGGRGPEGRAAP